MESQRNLLIIGLIFVTYLIYNQWQVDQNPPPPPTEVTSSESHLPATGTDLDLPTVKPTQQNRLPAATSGQTITIKTDVLELNINTQGGDITHAALLQYDAELHSADPFILLKQNKEFTYIAQTGLIDRDGPDASASGRPIYQVTNNQFQMNESQDSLTVPLTFVTESGLKVTKNYIFERGSYLVKVEYQLQNDSENPSQVRLFAQLKESISDSDSNLMMPVYRGGAYSTPEIRYKKYSFDDMKEKKLDITTSNGWVAFIQHYFVSAWLPQQDEKIHFYTNVINGEAIIGYKSANAIAMQPNQSATVSANLWIGPKLQQQMTAITESQGIGKNLEQTADYGWLWFISQPLFKLLTWFHSILGNWGLAIIFITFTVKGLLYPLTKAQYTSMAKMRLLQPKMTALRERFGDDKQKMSQAMMELYKKEKVNPLGGCFPILLQMPIFIALYYALMESVELRHAPFMLWINDLSVMDPYYILPALMGASMFLIQKMSPTTVTDPMQQKVMQFMPVIFTVFFIWFPSGLVLYWLMSNVVTLIQQWIIFRSLEKKGLHTKKSKNKAK